MSKCYTEELSDWMRQQQPPAARTRTGLADFLAVREDVRAAIEAGYSLKLIWQHLHSTHRIRCRYETFLRHVHQHLDPDPAASTGSSKAVSKSSTVKPALKAGDGSRSTAGNGIRGFSFNSTPKQEDLI